MASLLICILCLCPLIMMSHTSPCPSQCRCNIPRRAVYCRNNHHIHHIPSGIPLSTKELYVSFNDITRIRKDDFRGLKALTTLSLKKNGIATIEAGAFSELTNLSTLYLTANGLTHTDDDLFVNQTNLLYLYMGQNKLTALPNVRKCTKLKKLVLHGNALSNCTFLSYFESFNSLTEIILSQNKIAILHYNDFRSLRNSPVAEVTLSNCHIQHVDNDTFVWFRNLVSLKLSGTQLSTISLRNVLSGLRNNGKLHSMNLDGIALDNNILPDDIFDPLKNANLLQISMSHNRITILKQGTFKYFSKLQRLALRYCQIEHVDPDAFKGLDSLWEIRMNNNILQEIPLHLPATLMYADFSHNAISEVGKTVLANLRKLRQLFLNSNAIRRFENDAFEETDNLQILDLSFNRIASIGKQVLYTLDELKFLKLNDNKLAQIPTNAKMFSNLVSLQHLDLRNNGCDQMSPGLFSDLKNLSILLLQGNKLGETIAKDLTGELFSALSNLNELHLEGNVITYLPQSLFKNMASITALYLSNNRIRHWEKWTFQGAPNLRYLDLAYNQISLVNESSLASLQALNTFNLTGNPFACTCDLIWFRHWINKTNEIDLPNLNQYTCNSPQKFQGLLLTKFDPNSLVCTTTNWMMVIAISIGSTVFVVFISILIAYKYRWKIRLYMFKMRLINIRKNRNVGERAPLLQYDYDAYISHCPEDEEWVVETLLPVIDVDHRQMEAAEFPPQKQKFRLFFDKRDGLANKRFDDNMCYAMSKSRKILIVLSEDFFKDAKCFHFVLPLIPEIEQETQQEMSIVILKDKIPVNYINRIPRPILRKIEAGDILEWTDADPDGEELFWAGLFEKLKRP